MSKKILKKVKRMPIGMGIVMWLLITDVSG